ncbi:MAG: hypothetical protein HC829_04755, partial [Bacteroidales bacterium]|nr:hypothetical protein [Bacteroidales bacterium]
MAPARKIVVRAETFPLATAFTIARGSRTESQVVVVEIVQGGVRGHGECVPYARYGETVDGTIAAIRALADPSDALIELQCALARNLAILKLHAANLL